MTDDRVDGRTLRYQHRRGELLAAATEFVLDHGISDVSLRTIAGGLGVTHATLIRHFGSKRDLLAEVLDLVRADFARRLRDGAVSTHASGATDLIHGLWVHLVEPAEQRQFVLLFELAGHVARDGSERAQLERAVVGDWVALVVEVLRLDRPDETDDELLTARATALLAAVRGLQLDLLLTGDRPRVDAAFELITAGLCCTSAASTAG